MHSLILKVRLWSALRIVALAGTAFLMTGTAVGEIQPRLNVMPMPASVQMGSGQLLIDRTFSVAVTGFHDAMLDGGVERFKDRFRDEQGCCCKSRLTPRIPHSRFAPSMPAKRC